MITHSGSCESHSVSFITFWGIATRVGLGWVGYLAHEILEILPACARTEVLNNRAIASPPARRVTAAEEKRWINRPGGRCPQHNTELFWRYSATQPLRLTSFKQRQPYPAADHTESLVLQERILVSEWKRRKMSQLTRICHEVASSDPSCYPCCLASAQSSAYYPWNLNRPSPVQRLSSANIVWHLLLFLWRVKYTRMCIVYKLLNKTHLDSVSGILAIVKLGKAITPVMLQCVAIKHQQNTDETTDTINQHFTIRMITHKAIIKWFSHVVSFHHFKDYDSMYVETSPWSRCSSPFHNPWTTSQCPDPWQQKETKLG